MCREKQNHHISVLKHVWSNILLHVNSISLTFIFVRKMGKVIPAYLSFTKILYRRNKIPIRKMLSRECQFKTMMTGGKENLPGSPTCELFTVALDMLSHSKVKTKPNEVPLSHLS